MTDLSGILVRLRQVDETVRELTAGGKAQAAGMQAKLEEVSGQLGQIVGALELYVHAEVMHHTDDPGFPRVK